MSSIIKEVVRNFPRPPSKEERMKNKVGNPIQLIRSLTLMQGLMFFSGWWAWTMDAYDFFSVSLTVKRLGETFGESNHNITTSITLTLLFRSLGAALFGLISDRYGRKWPLVANLIIVAILELATGFVDDFGAFLGVRSLFGIGMGGIWGLAAATGLENMPVQARGLFSGILQEGYAVGYLIAACVNLSVVPHYDSWRPIFFVGAGLSLGSAIFRALLPESEFFLRAKEARGDSGPNKTKVFMHEAWKAVKTNWWRCLFSFLLMTGFNFFSHGSQDLLPVFYQESKGFNNYWSTVLTIIGNCGAIAGGVIAGWMSQFLGRRLTIIIFCIFAAVFIPLWILPDHFSGLAAGVFFVQVGVQGAWGVIPVYLNEISPPAFRAVFPGLAYQLGNMASSGSSQIEATAGDNLRTTVNGEDAPDYGKIQAILIGVVAAWIIFWTAVGKEYHGAHFEATKPAFEKDAGVVKPAALTNHPTGNNGDDIEAAGGEKQQSSSQGDEKDEKVREEEMVESDGRDQLPNV